MFKCKALGSWAQLWKGNARFLSSRRLHTKNASLPSSSRKQIPSRACDTTLFRRCKSTMSKEPATSATTEKGTLYAFMTKERKVVGTFVELCGHSSAALAVFSYLNTDIIALRCIAICSGVLHSSFNYFRSPPLWTPLYWNALIMTINVCMVGSLVIEKNEAENMPSEKKRLYDSGDFDKRGFSKVQFKKFFENGQLRVFKRELLTQENRQMDKLYYIIDGNAIVTSAKDGRKLATNSPHHFVGEMAFLEYYQDMRMDKDASFAKASANVMAGDLVHVWEWDARRLAHVLMKDRDLSNAWASYCNYDLREKLLSANAEGGLDGVVVQKQ
mmetsp:Transcript_19725/g.33952  ORF Transcript_19725/g.33952 Transcript_19725/m.33952 type:complete len:329 (+) Transcript_19725:188-1174(+)